MDKLLRGAGGTLTLTSYDATGALADVNSTNAPDVVTVYDSAGTSAATPTGTRASAGTYQAIIPVTFTTLDVFSVVWHFANGAVRYSAFEVVGSFLYSTAEFRSYDPALASTTTYPTQRVIDVREAVEDRFAAIARVSFTRRGQREFLDGDGSNSVIAYWPRVLAVTTVKVGGTTVDATTVKVHPTGRIELVSGSFSSGQRNVELLYEHGYDPAPSAVVEAGKRYGRELIVKGAFDDMSRATSVLTDLGLMRIAQAGQGRVGIPEVDAVLADLGYTGALIG